MKPLLKSSKEDEIDFFALWEKKQSKSKIQLTKDMSSQKSSEIVQEKMKEYTKEDEQRRLQIKKAKEEIYLLATSQHEKVNKITKESYDKKRREFINIKKVLQAEVNTSRYRKSS